MGKIEYPIEVSGIDVKYWDGKPFGGLTDHKRPWVMVRPCADRFGNHTYLGVLLGDVIISPFIQHDPASKKMQITPSSNPAIFIPDFNEVVMGYESWWGYLDKPEDLEQITDKDIENIWYVKALKELSKKTEETPAQ